MSWYLVVRFLHIFSATMLIGGIFGRQLIRSYVKNADNVHDIATLSRAAGRIENFMVIPGNLAVILFGVILALMIKAPIFGFLQGAPRNWLLVSNLLLLLGFLAVPLFFVPRGKKFDIALQNALDKQEITLELRVFLDDKIIQVAHVIEMFVVVCIAFLMVFKPF